MNFASIATVGLLVATFNVGTARAQGLLTSSPVKTTGQGLGRLCVTNQKTEAAEEVTLNEYNSPDLEKVLLSSETFWRFITDPSTPYLDRMAAANRGGAVLSPAELPLLWQAMAEVETFPTGVAPPPCSSILVFDYPVSAASLIGRKSNAPSEPTSRVVLGREVQLPTKTIDFPVTAEERDRSPWLWQMGRVLSILFEKVNIYYGDPGRYPLRVQAAWDWPIPVPTYRPGTTIQILEPSDWEKINIRSRALTELAPHEPLVLQTIVKLARNNDNYYVAYSSHVDDLSSRGKDSYHYEELVHTAQIVILQKTGWEDVARRTAFVTAQLSFVQRDPWHAPFVQPLKTATSILAIGRWATDKSVNPWNRYYSFVGPICRIVDDPPFPPDQLRDPDDPRLDEKLRTFEAWFERQKPVLEQQAAAERPHLQSLAKELSTDSSESTQKQFTWTKKRSFYEKVAGVNILLLFFFHSGLLLSGYSCDASCSPPCFYTHFE